MRKYIFLYTLLMICAIGKAQTNIDKFSIGVNCGINNSYFTPFLEDEFFPSERKLLKTKTSFRYGVGINYQLKSKFSARIAVNYEERGWLRDSQFFANVTSGGREFLDADFFFHFISIPFIFEYQLGNKIKWYPRLGIVMGIPLKVDGKGILVESKDHLVPITELSPSSNRSPNIYWDKAISLGAAFKIPYREMSINFSANYQVSLNSTTPVLFKSLHHQAFSALVELDYPIAKLWKKNR